MQRRWLVCLIVLGFAATASAQTMTTSMPMTDFGSVHVGTAGTTTRTITINNGAGGGALDFTVTSTLADYVAVPASGSIPAGGSQNVVVTFTPASRGARGANITIAGNDTANPSDAFGVTGIGTSGNLVINNGGSPTVACGQAQVAGGSTQCTFTVANLAPANETLTFALEVTAGATDFTVTQPADLSLDIGESATITVTFNPSAVGARSGTVRVTSDDSARPTVNVTVQGTGNGAQYTPTLATYDFGTVPVGSFVERTVVITNTGNQSGMITSIASGNAAYTFAVVGAALPRTLAPTESLSVTVRFTPVDGSIVATNLSFGVTNTDLPLVVPLTGDGLYEDVALAATGEADLMIDLGNARVGVLVAKTITVTNTGETQAIVALPTSDDTICTIMGVSGTTFPATLDPAEVATFEIRVTPTAVGIADCTITVTSDIPTTDTVEIDLVGVAPSVTVLNPTTAAINFGVVDVDAAQTIRTVVLDNPGTAPLAVGPCTIAGSTRFAVQTSCSNLSIAPGTNATLMVSFDPMVEASETATLTIGVDALGVSMIQIALSGVGADQRLDLSALAVSFPDTPVNTGEPPIEYIDVFNPTNPTTGVAETLHIESATTDNEVFVLANQGPFVVEPGARIRLAITFSPTMAGVYDGQLVVVSDASGTPMAVITLHGRAVVTAVDESGGCCQSSAPAHAPLALVVLMIVIRRRRRR